MSNVVEICREVPKWFYVTRPLNEHYAENCVFPLLLGTAAQESGGFKWRRQLRFKDFPFSIKGAFSLWQMEIGSILDSLIHLTENDALRENLETELGKRIKNLPPLHPQSIGTILYLIQTEEGDWLAATLARLHYLRCPGTIPATVEGQANYWKTYYNTRLGKGRPSQYRMNFNSYAVEAIREFLEKEEAARVAKLEARVKAKSAPVKAKAKSNKNNTGSRSGDSGEDKGE